MSIVGKILKEGREKAKLSQKEVSDHFGYKTPQFVSNWERGVSHPPVESIKKLSKFINVPAKTIARACADEKISEINKSYSKLF